ncbi:MAG: peptide chain release factor N(5)-glutamine methyltransferase [Bacteroidota bacterium]|nr:peptide chain release factor N(5)-glutamine methyltransferase [Bacteroidota bacterium]
MTTEQIYKDFITSLEGIYEAREAATISDWIFENVTHLERRERRGDSYKINNDQLLQLEVYKNELLLHKPIQYVLNEAWFYKRKFFVNEHVLIPRPETEELVSWMIVDIKNTKDILPEQDATVAGLRILDIGTGSGCIAISVKKELNNIDVIALDVNEQALAVAKKNADHLQAKIDFVCNNFLDEATWNSFGQYDVIVSNPPYIPENEKKILSKNVTDFEPGIALFVPDNDPFIFYKKIAKFAQVHLNPSGKIYMEVHENYANKVLQIFKESNFKTEIREDIYGKQRMLKAW